MESLKGHELKLACSVLHDRYKACVATSMVKDVLASADVNALSRKCAPLFADLTEFCSDMLRKGELQLRDKPAAATK